MTTDTLGPLWHTLKQLVNPPSKLLHDELLAANVTLLIKEFDGTIKFKTYTIPTEHKDA